MKTLGKQKYHHFVQGLISHFNLKLVSLLKPFLTLNSQTTSIELI